MSILHIFLTGFGILIGAILLNLIANSLSIASWYEVIGGKKGLTFLDYFWLFIAYPFLLGAVANLMNKWMK